MRRYVASSLVCAGALGVLALFAGPAGCAAGSTSDDGTTPTQDANPTDPNSTKLPPSSGSGGSSTGDDNDSDNDNAPIGDGGIIKKSDGGTTTKDSGVDSGPPAPPAPVPDAVCTTKDQIVAVACGFCGTQRTICETKADGTLGWSEYDACSGTHGVCAAGSTAQQACNNCGTRTVTCSASCTWQAGACSAAANTGCVPGSWDLTTAGCTTASAGPFRVRQCSSDPATQCTYGGYSSCEAPPTTIEVGPSIGSISSTIAILGGQIGKMSPSGCPATLISSTMVAYAYTQVHNGLAKDATVDIYNSAAPGGTVTDTAIMAYNAAVPPVAPADRKACMQASNEGTSSLSGSFDLASMDGTKAITIPAGQTITIYTNSTDSPATSGPVKVNVKVESVAP